MRKVFIVVITCVACALDLSSGQWVGQGLTQQSLAQIVSYQDQELDLSKNDIESLSINQFINFTKLHTLILDKNENFDFVPKRKFLIAPSLQKFSCNSCNISRIYNETFEGLVSLKVLDLSFNKLTTIESDAFETNQKLVKIILNSNHIKVINPEVFTPTLVDHLNLNGNKDLVFEARKYLVTKQLTILELKGAGFEELTAKMLSNLPALEHLDLSENNIRSIETGAFESNKDLDVLYLEDNALKVFDPKLIADVRNLSVLCLDGNEFIRDSRNVRLQELYMERGYRNGCYARQDHLQRFENLDLMPIVVPKNDTEEVTPTPPKENPGISDAFIGSYIALIVIIQTVALVVLVWYLIILTKPSDSKDQIDYASTILNDNQIYAVDRRR